MANGSKSFFKRSGKQSCSAVSKVCNSSQSCGNSTIDGSCVVVDDTAFLLGLTTTLQQILAKCVKQSQAFLALQAEILVTGDVAVSPKTFVRLVYIRRHTRPADGVYDLGILYDIYEEVFGPEYGPLLFQEELT